jgi:hypothetical protein
MDSALLNPLVQGGLNMMLVSLFFKVFFGYIGLALLFIVVYLSLRQRSHTSSGGMPAANTSASNRRGYF